MRSALLWAYPVALAILSIAVALAEALAPKRKSQRRWRRHLPSDFAHLVFNGHFVGLVVFGLATRWILPPLDSALARAGLIDRVYRNLASEMPLWLQIVVALVAIDFLQWIVHVMLHRVPALWELHKTHHTVADGEMDWIVSFRFHWLELAWYHACLYLPLAFFGFAPVAVLVHAIVGTLVGHLNHANLDLGHGWWRYLVNSPRMHIWHHDHAATARTTVNFGIIFSAWDWIFGTARLTDEPPARLGFAGAEAMPQDFLGLQAWPLSRLLTRRPLAASALGLVVLVGAWELGHAVPARTRTPMFGERVAASQPAEDHHVYARDAADADRALVRFGEEARTAGFAHPEDLVSVRELAAALGSARLRLIDVRPAPAFERGHIPSARRMERSDYSFSEPIPGMSKSARELQAALRARGVAHDSLVVFYGDGGPEPFRLFWTLRIVANYRARVLDGGLQEWKREGRGVAAGPPLAIADGDVALTAPAIAPLLAWSDVEPIAHRAGAVLLDTRSEREFAGAIRHPEAARAGHIPGARNLEWLTLLRDGSQDGDSRLKLPAALRATLAAVGVDGSGPVVSYCQTGTRSSVAWFAMRQIGLPDEQLVNYNGSWSEYSRLPAP